MISAQSADPLTADRDSAVHGPALSNGDGPAVEASVDDADLEEPRPRYSHAILAGGLGGLTGDMLMHSLDTVKTRQQGDPHRPPKYHSLGNTAYTIWRQEGVRRGLYGGVTPAMIGSFGGTSIFFGSYEWSKRFMIDHGVTPSIAYLNAGFFADLVASPLYVPTEVIKTRLQLQGRYNNPFFKSGYNYQSSWHALRTIARVEGFGALFYGYKATLYRDLPFSALQFAFYEKERELAKSWVGSKHIGLPLEILTGVTAGGMAGVLTCPLDVVKTRIQTQVHTLESPSPHNSPPAQPRATHHLQASRPQTETRTRSGVEAQAQVRQIFTHAPSKVNATSVTLDTSSVIQGLRIIYRSEGIGGWFRGVGPRGLWTSIQSGTMLVLYQQLLQFFDMYWLSED